MVRVPIAPQVEAQVPQGPSGAPQFQAPPMPGMQESQQLAQQFMRAGQAALDIERDEQALSLLQAKKQERAALKAQAERDAFNESRVKDLLQKTSIQADAIADTFLGSQMADAADYSGTLTSIREAFKATVDSLENEQQKELYGAKAETMLLAYDRDLRRHSARERKRYEVAQSMSEAEAFGNRAVRHAESIGEPTGDHTMFLLAGVQQLRDAYAKQGLPANDPVSQQKVQQFGAAIADALWRDRSLVKTWAMRGTLHLVAAHELPELVALPIEAGHEPYLAWLDESVLRLRPGPARGRPGGRPGPRSRR